MSYLLILLIKKGSSNLLPSLFFRPPTFKKHIFKEVDECNGTITNFHKVLLILVIFGIKECYFSDCTNTKNKKSYFWDKRVLLFWLHKQTTKKRTPPPPKKNQPKTTTTTTTTKTTHTIVGREKWLLYFQV